MGGIVRISAFMRRTTSYISPTIVYYFTSYHPPLEESAVPPKPLVVPWNLDEEEVKRQIDARAAEKAENAVGRGRRGTCAMEDALRAGVVLRWRSSFARTRRFTQRLRRHRQRVIGSCNHNLISVERVEPR